MYSDFFSDALDGHMVTPTPAGVSVCLDKKVRTGLTSAIGTPLNVSLSWTPAVAYDSVCAGITIYFCLII